jgi:hypothetical protein
VLEWADQAGAGDGSSIVDFGEGFSLTASNKIVTNKLYSTNETDDDVHYRLELDTNGVVVLPDQSIINGSTLRGAFGTGELNYTGITIGPDADHREESWVWVDSNGAHVGTSYSTDAHTWSFTNTGNLQLPVGGDILDSNGASVLGGSGNVDLGKFKIVDDNGVAFLATTDDADGYGGYDIAIAPSGESSAYIQIPNNANSEIGAPLTINSLAANSSVQINTDWADPWIFGANGVLIAPDDIIVGSTGEGGRFIQDCDNGTSSMRWINVTINGDGNTELIRAYSGDPDDDNETGRERAQVSVNWLDDYQSGLTIRAFDRTNVNNTVEHDWIFQGDGNLTLPPGGDILDSEGISVLSTVGARNITLSQSSTIADAAAGVELTINRPTTEWYSVYGDINTPTGANATVVGSVVHDAGGNIYVVGSTVDYDDNNYEGHNLYLKYNTEGVLEWSRTWTDQNGIACGSYNSSVRFLPVTAGTADQETIYWSSYAPYAGLSSYAYVGTMDTDGNLVSGFGNVRAPVQLANVRIADLEVATGSNVRVVGARFGYGTYTSTPFIATVNLDTYTANLAITISPPDIDINNTNSSTNFFKSACSGTANNSVIAIGTYYNDDYSREWPILTEHIPGGTTRTYHLTSTRPGDNIYGEAVVKSSYDDALYVIMNEPTEGNYAFVGKLASNLSDYSWMCRFDDGSAYLLGMTFDTDGFIYVFGEVYIYNDGDYNADFLLVKMDDSADIIWQRKIGSTAYEGSGANEAFSPGWQSSTGISVQGDHVVIAGITDKLNDGQPNAFTIKYPTDGSLTGIFGQYYAAAIEVSIDPEWNENINNLTADTIVTQIDGNTTFRNDVTEAALTASTKTLDAGYDQLHWDMTNNYLYDPERKWTFGKDGLLTFPGGAVVDTADNTFEVRDVDNFNIEATNAVNIYTAVEGNGYQWQFRDNSGLQFPDGTTQYGAYIDQEIALDGGSAGSVFPINITNPRLADGGGSGARYGTTAPNYDGSSSGADIGPEEFTLTLNGGGA